MPGPALGFFSGLLRGGTNALLTKQKEKHDAELAQQQQLSNVYLKAVESGDIDPQFGIPLVANIIHGSFSNLTGDKKGSKKDKSFFSDVLGDPEKLSGLMLGLHKATTSSPASGPAGPTGLPTAGPTGSGGGLDGAQDGPGSPLASRSGTMGVPARTSIFRSSGEGQALDDAAKRRAETFKTDEEIRRYKATTGQKAPVTKPPTGPVGQKTSEWLAQEGLTWDEADADQRRLALEEGVKGVTADRQKKEADAAKKAADAAAKKTLSADEKEGQHQADLNGETDWASLPDGKKQAYITLGAKVREQKTQLAIQRAKAQLSKSYIDIAKDKDQLALLEKEAPLILQMKKLQIDSALSKVNAPAKGGTGQDPAAIIKAAQMDAHKIATDTNKTRWFSTLRDAFGDTAPSEQEIADKLIQERTGEDPATLRAQSAAKRQGPAKPVTSPSTIKTKNGTFTIEPAP